MEIKCESYILYTKTGGWLGQVVLTSNGSFMSITDYGNLSFYWGSYTCEEQSLELFKKFLLGLSVQYFAEKMFCGIAYINSSRTTFRACNRFAENILPSLQEKLKEEFEHGKI